MGTAGVAEAAVAYPTWLDRAAYPFATRYEALPAGRMHVVDEGEGPPVVMVHGNPTWSFAYRDLILRLRDRHRCVAMDHLGFGLSDKLRGWSYLPEDHAANLTTLIETLDLRDVTLVVQDWGGPLGMAYATAHPQNVARLVILNTWAWPVDRDPYYLAFSGFMGGAIGGRLIRRRNFFVRSVMRRAYGDARLLTPEVHAHYLEALPTPQDREGSAVFPRQIVASTDSGRWVTTCRRRRRSAWRTRSRRSSVGPKSEGSPAAARSGTRCTNVSPTRATPVLLSPRYRWPEPTPRSST